MTIDRFLIVLLLIAVVILVYVVVGLFETIDSLHKINASQNRILSNHSENLSLLNKTAIDRGELLIKILNTIGGEEEDGREQ